MNYSKNLLTTLLLSVFMITSFQNLAQAQTDDTPVLRYTITEDFGLKEALDTFILERLREQGYEIEVTIFAESSFMIDGLATGKIDFGDFSSRTMWRATAANANTITVADLGMDFVMIGSASIQSCEDWQDATIAYQSETSLSAAMGNHYFANVCTEFFPDAVYIGGSPNRSAALLSGAIDATIVHLDSGLILLRESGDDFQIVANLPNEFPWLVGTGLHFSGQFAEDYAMSVWENASDG